MAASNTTGEAGPGTPVAPTLAVVVPLHNEVESVRPLIDEIGATLDGVLDYEIVAVDDGSDDGTGAKLAGLAPARPRLRVIRHRARAGQSAALATGIKAARAPVIATIDGDGQNDPADVPRLLGAFEEAGVEARDSLMVAGLRARRRDGWVKRASARFANRARARLLKDETVDTGCGLKVFSRAAFLDMPRFDHMHRFLPALMLRRGGRVVSVAVNHRPRARGASKYGVLDRLWVGIVDTLGVMWLQRRGSVPVIDEDRGTGP